MRIHLHFLCKIRARREMRAMRDAGLIALMESNSQLHKDMNELKGQITGLARYVRRREQLMNAAYALADKLDDNWLASQVADCMSDSELAALLDLFHVTGRPDAVLLWEGYHTADEDDPDPFAEDENQDQDQAQPTAA